MENGKVRQEMVVFFHLRYMYLGLNGGIKMIYIVGNNEWWNTDPFFKLLRALFFLLIFCLF